MTRVLPFHSPPDLAAAVAAVREVTAAHQVVALPTETFYGLAVPPADQEALARLYRLKQRPAEKLAPVVAANLAQVEALVYLDALWRERLARVWPAPLTVVLPAREGGTLAVRVPAHELLRVLLAQVGPRTATSANRSGAPPAATAEEVQAALGDELELLLDGGATPGGAPSSIVDATLTPPRLLRSGAFPVPAEWGVKSV